MKHGILTFLFFVAAIAIYNFVPYDLAQNPVMYVIEKVFSATAGPQFAKAAPPTNNEKAKAYELLTPASKEMLKEDHTRLKFADGTSVFIHKDLITTREEDSGLVVHFADLTWRLKDGTVRDSTMAYTGCDKGKGYMARVVDGTVTDRQMQWSRANAGKKDGALDAIAAKVCLNVLQIAYEGLDD